MQRWLSVAAGLVAFGPAAARLVQVFGTKNDPKPLIERSHVLLSVFEQELSSRKFLAAEHPTIADIACYTYVAHAPEGGVSLGDYPNVRAWLARIEALDGFVPMRSTPVALAS